MNQSILYSDNSNPLLLSQFSITEDTTFSINSSGAVINGGGFLRILADGIHNLTFSGMKQFENSPSYRNINGVLNLIRFWFDGTDYWYFISGDQNLVINVVPIASNVTLTGNFVVGQTVNGSYVFNSNGGSDESGTTFRIQKANDNTGTGSTDIATTENFTITSSELNKYLRLGVTPKNSNGTVGTEVFSAWSVQVAGADTTAPVPTFSPIDGATSVSRSIIPTITFNEPIRNTDHSTIDNSNVAALITLKDTNNSGANISFTATISTDKKTITITPVGLSNTTNVLYLAVNNFEDSSSNQVTTAISVTFTLVAATNTLDPLSVTGVEAFIEARAVNGRGVAVYANGTVLGNTSPDTRVKDLVTGNLLNQPTAAQRLVFVTGGSDGSYFKRTNKQGLVYTVANLGNNASTLTCIAFIRVASYTSGNTALFTALSNGTIGRMVCYLDTNRNLALNTSNHDTGTIDTYSSTLKPIIGDWVMVAWEIDFVNKVEYVKLITLDGTILSQNKNSMTWTAGTVPNTDSHSLNLIGDNNSTVAETHIKGHAVTKNAVLFSDTDLIGQLNHFIANFNS